MDVRGLVALVVLGGGALVAACSDGGSSSSPGGGGDGQGGEPAGNTGGSSHTTAGHAGSAGEPVENPGGSAGMSTCGEGGDDCLGGGAGAGGGGALEVEGLDCHDQPFKLDVEHVRQCVRVAACTDVLSIAHCLRSPGTIAVFDFLKVQGKLKAAGPRVGAEYPSCAPTAETCDELSECAKGTSPELTAVGTCDEPGTAYCDGDQRAYCNPDGELFRTPACAGAGELTCAVALGNAGPEEVAVDCVPEGCGALWDEQVETCDGEDYVATQGYWNELRIHCPDFGFATCHGGRCVD
jgi:hypothetical protein